MAVVQAIPTGLNAINEHTMNMVCEEEKLSEFQQKVYQDWEKKVKEYDLLMKKHKEEEQKYQKAVKAVDTRVGLKDSEPQSANGPTKFLRSVPSTSPQGVRQSSTGPVMTKPIHTSVPTSSLIRVTPAQPSIRQQLTYGGGQLTGRVQTGVSNSVITSTTFSNPRIGPLPGVQSNSNQQNVIRPGTYLNQNGTVKLATKATQPGTTYTNVQGKSIISKTGNVIKIPYQQPQNVRNQVASQGLKRPADTPPLQEIKRAKEAVFDSRNLIKFYPFKKGQQESTEDASRRFKIKCFHCNETMASNIQYGTHVKKIVESQWPDSSTLNSIVVCPKCFKRFRTPFEMQEHLERSHVKGAPFQCFTCDLSFTNSPSLMKHMNLFHSPSQMPFRCQICNYTTSAYADITEHFSMKHEGYKALMCPYCLKMIRCSKTFLQHCQKHIQSAMKVTTGVFPCKNCKLSFVSTTERAEHFEKDHKKYDIKFRDGVPRFVRDTLKSLEIMATAGINPATQSPAKPKVQVETKYVFTQQSSGKKMACMECGLLFENFASHFSRSLNCQKCVYSTFCPKSLSNHMILFHREDREKPMVGKVKKTRLSDGTFQLTCSVCKYQTKAPTHMAHHRAKKCIQRSVIEWISYLFMPSTKKFESGQSKVVDVIVLDSDEDN